MAHFFLDGDRCFLVHGRSVYSGLQAFSVAHVHDGLLLPVGAATAEHIALVAADKTLLLFSSSFEPLGWQALPKAATVLRFHNKHLYVGDKFGDVYRLPVPCLVPRTLVLGHVSLLTDMVVTDEQIVTCDRDEKIRATRLGVPAIIDQYLWGHREYVSRLAVLGDGTLVSGGGDGRLLFWTKERTWRLAKETELEADDIVDMAGLGTRVVVAPENRKHVFLVQDGRVDRLDVGEEPLAVALDAAGGLLVATATRILRLGEDMAVVGTLSPSAVIRLRGSLLRKARRPADRQARAE